MSKENPIYVSDTDDVCEYRSIPSKVGQFQDMMVTRVSFSQGIVQPTEKKTNEPPHPSEDSRVSGEKGNDLPQPPKDSRVSGEKGNDLPQPPKDSRVSDEKENDSDVSSKSDDEKKDPLYMEEEEEGEGEEEEEYEDEEEEEEGEEEDEEESEEEDEEEPDDEERDPTYMAGGKKGTKRNKEGDSAENNQEEEEDSAENGQVEGIGGNHVENDNMEEEAQENDDEMFIDEDGQNHIRNVMLERNELEGEISTMISHIEKLDGVWEALEKQDTLLEKHLFIRNIFSAIELTQKTMADIKIRTGNLIQELRTVQEITENFEHHPKLSVLRDEVGYALEPDQLERGIDRLQTRIKVNSKTLDQWYLRINAEAQKIALSMRNDQPPGSSDAMPDAPPEQSAAIPEVPPEQSAAIPEVPPEQSGAVPEAAQEQSDAVPEVPPEQSDAVPEVPPEQSDAVPEVPPEQSGAVPEAAQEQSDAAPEAPQEPVAAAPEDLAIPPSPKRARVAFSMNDFHAHELDLANHEKVWNLFCDYKVFFDKHGREPVLDDRRNVQTPALDRLTGWITGNITVDDDVFWKLWNSTAYADNKKKIKGFSNTDPHQFKPSMFSPTNVQTVRVLNTMINTHHACALYPVFRLCYAANNVPPSGVLKSNAKPIVLRIFERDPNDGNSLNLIGSVSNPAHAGDADVITFSVAVARASLTFLHPKQ